MCSQHFKFKVFQAVYNVEQRLQSLLKCGATKIVVLLCDSSKEKLVLSKSV